MRLLVCALILVADMSATIVTQTYCYTDGLSTSDPSGCDLVSPQMGRATANISPTTITFGGTFLSATIGVSVNTVQSFPTNPNSTIGGSSEASAASDLSLVLLTAGLQRPGFLKIDWEVNGGPPYDGSYDANLTVGSLSLTRPFGNFCCSPLFPFDLGQVFSFQTNVSQLAYAVFQDGVSGGFNNASVTLRFYETDGSTPVRIEETAVFPTAVPEPRFLVILGVAGRWLFSKHRRGFDDANRI